MTRPRGTGAGKIAAAPRAPRPTGILAIHACMINSDYEISDSEIISTGILVLIYRYTGTDIPVQPCSELLIGRGRRPARTDG